jgi:GR25 family glycosyltransferase involved in LPS biosynthesis
MEDQLCKQTIPYFRTEGVLCEDFLNYKIDEKIEHGSNKHKGTVGCFLAHKKALINLSNCNLNSEDIVLVMEDDVIINPIFWEYLSANSFYKKAEIIFFNAACCYSWSKLPKKESVISEKKKFYEIYCGHPTFLGAFAYITKYKFLNNIISKMENINTYDDVDCGFYYKNFKCYTYITENISVDTFKSDRDSDSPFNKDGKDG